MSILENTSFTADKAVSNSQFIPADAAAGRQAFLQGLSQHARLVSIETSLGSGAFIVERFTGHEEMSDLFRFDVDCLGTSSSLELKAIIGEEACLRIRLPNGGSRAIHGVITRARQLGTDGAIARYGLSLEPWAYALRLRRDSFVFQDKTVLEIVSEVFSDYPSANYRFEIKSELPRRSVTIQYRESDYAFIQRLLAEEGLNFYFIHTDSPRSAAGPHSTHTESEGKLGRHQLVVFDDNAYLSACSQPAIRFHRADSTEKNDAVIHFTHDKHVHANRVSLGSWDYKKAAAISTEYGIQDHGDIPALEVFEGNGAYRFTDRVESSRIAQARAESLALEQDAAYAESSVRALGTGTWFSLTDHPEADGEYVVLSIAHEGANNLSAGTKDIGTTLDTKFGSYRNRFTCITRDTPVRPPFWHSKPTAPGAQIGLVVGVDNEEITTERDHRIKVQFPWQRGDRPAQGQISHPTTSNAPGNETAGTWIRVAEPAAGLNWGAHFLPRIGQEVCIDFISGDIDRPVVTGRLYNTADMPSLHGADNHPGALSGIRTKEYTGNGFNAWMIDDTPGQLRQAVNASYAASQLNLGYLIRLRGNIRGAYRGTGFELATDAWSALRAKRGMFISTSHRSRTASPQLDTQEAHEKFKVARDITKTLSDAAAQHQALPLSTPNAIERLDKVIWASDSVDGLSIPTFERPLTLIDSQAAVLTATPASSAMMSGQDLTLTTTKATRITAGQSVSLATGKVVSLFTHAGGAKAIAAKERVSICADTGPTDILAEKAVTITSSNANIIVQAKQEILLVSGGGYIKLVGSNIDIHCPSAVSVKGTTHDFLGAGKNAAALSRLPDTRPKLFNEQFRALDKETGKPVPGLPYQIKMQDGTVLSGITDEYGRTMRVATADQEELRIFWGELAHDENLLEEDN